MTDERWRLFVGLPAPPDVREQIDRKTAALRTAEPHARWVATSNLHVTLLFLGDLGATEVPGIVAAIHDVARGHAPYQIELQGAGTFGSGRRGRTVWLKVGRGRVETAALCTDLAAALQSGEAAQDAAREPSPHLTLARAAGSALVTRARAELADLTLRWHIEHVHLYRSRLGRGPPVYEELAAVRLGEEQLGARSAPA